MGFEAYLKRWLGHVRPVNENISKDVNTSKFDDINNTIEGGIGGELSNSIAKTTSLESIESVLSKLDLQILQKVKTEPSIQKVLLSLLSPEKLIWVNEYITKSKKNLNTIISDKKKVDFSSNFDKFTRLTLKEADIKAKIYKLYLIFKYAEDIPDLDNDTNILSYIKNKNISLLSSFEENSTKYTIGRIGRLDNTIQSNEFEVFNEAGESKIFQKGELKNLLEINPEVAEKAKEITTESYRKKLNKVSNRVEQTIQKEIANSLNYNTEVIDNLPNDEKTIEKIQSELKPLLDALGYLKFYSEPIRKKEEKIIAKEKPSLRKKNRIREKLMTALRLALLPYTVNGKISESGGDYFKLLKRLESQNAAWLEASIKEVLNSPERITQFATGPRIKESSLEEDQLAYLYICSNWIRKYILSEVDGELSKRDSDNAIERVKTTTQEKEKEIKNYYLSKDFNMKDFKGIQLKPNIKLPLYQRVKLTVSETDRIAESPLKNLLKGLGQITTGLLSSIPITIDQALAKRNADQNKAIFNGIFSIIRGSAYAISKQTGRDFEKQVKKIGDRSKTDYTKNTNEQETGGISPGTSMQVPGTLPDSNMDTFALAEAGKKITSSNKIKKKKRSIIPKIATFKDFLKD